MLKKKYAKEYPAAFASMKRNLAGLIKDQSWDRKQLEQELIAYFSIADPLKPHEKIHALALNFCYCPYRLAIRLQEDYGKIAPQTTQALCHQLNRKFVRSSGHRRTTSEVDRLAIAAAAAVYASLDSKQKIRYLISKYVWYYNNDEC